MQLVLLVLILVAPYVVLTLLGIFVPRMALSRDVRGRVALSVFFTFTGLGHFIKTDELASMLPPWFPVRVPMIYLTGIFELLGAIGIWIPRLRKLTGALLILMMIAVLPANIYAAMERVPFGGHEIGPIYLFARVPVQMLLIAWIYFTTIAAGSRDVSTSRDPRRYS